jgi:hypothetical protein
MRTQDTKGTDLIPETQTNKCPPSDVLNMDERDDVLWGEHETTHAAVPKIHGKENDDDYSLRTSNVNDLTTSGKKLDGRR